MSVVLLTRILALLIGVGSWLLLRYPKIWKGFAWVWLTVWDNVKHIIVSILVSYVSYGLLTKLWYAYPELYLMTEASFNGGLESLAEKLYNSALFLLSLFGTKTFEAILNGFNITH